MSRFLVTDGTKSRCWKGHRSGRTSGFDVCMLGKLCLNGKTLSFGTDDGMLNARQRMALELCSSVLCFHGWDRTLAAVME